MSKKIQVNFDDGALEVIDRLKEATGSNAGDVIRDALSFYEWARQQYDQGKKVGTIQNGRGITEVLLPFELRGKLKSKSQKNEG
jgi:Ribbon-helix-helix protein, copG family